MKKIESKFLRDKHHARRIAFQALFQLDFNHESDDAQKIAIDTAIAEAEKFNEDMRGYVERTVDGAWNFRAQIDEQITKFSTGWNIRRMTAVDRNLLRLAIFEMKFAEKPLPAGVVINEIVELAKIFGSDESPKFVNGLLGAFSRDGQPREKKSKSDQKSKSESSSDSNSKSKTDSSLESKTKSEKQSQT